ncbi:MAG: hypothetical protein AAFW69_08845, partial [Pseudomonadota bacterium]
MIRAEAARFLLRWGEAGAMAVVAVAAAVFAVRAGGRGETAVAVVLGLGAVGAGALAWPAVLRARILGRAAPAPGVVVVTEGRLSYFGPDRGGVLPRAAE